jgi:hypothetical protein
VPVARVVGVTWVAFANIFTFPVPERPGVVEITGRVVVVLERM